MLRSPLAVPKAYWLRKADDSTDGDSTCCDGKPVFHYNLVGVQRYNVAGPDKLSPGKHTVVVDFKYDGGGHRQRWTRDALGGRKTGGPREIARGRFRFAFQRTKRSTSAKTRALRSARTTMCRLSSRARRKVVILLGDEKITAADEKAIEQAAADLSTDE